MECCWVISLLASQFVNFICDIISIKFPLKSCLNCCKIFVFHHYPYEIIFFFPKDKRENDIYKSRPNLVQIFILSNLLNSCIISTQIDNQNCLKMWKLPSGLSWYYRNISVENSGAKPFNKTLKPIKRCFGLGFCPSWINPTGPCDFEQSILEPLR